MKRTMIGSIVLAGALALTGCSSDGADVGTDVDADVETDVGTEDSAGAEDEDGDVSLDVATDASVTFGGLQDGDTVSSPVSVTFETDGFDIIPAEEGGGEASGHMHVMVDVGCVTVGETIPDDESHLHFGDGSTSAELELEPGQHTLCLQAGDGEHTALDVTEEITITVE